MTIVLSPRPAKLGNNRGVCPPLGPIAGRKIGLRRDQFWNSWDWVTDEWAQALREDGAEPVIWRAPVGKGDKDMSLGADEFTKFLDDVDATIMGLCNCGSCTYWAINDTVTSLNRGYTTIAVSTEHFEPLARALAAERGHEELRVKLLPYPLEGRVEVDVRRIARKHYEAMLDVLGAVR